MTRINLISPNELTDQHLFAEYREITRIFALVKAAQDKHSINDILAKIPSSYRLGAGHVLFFYDKLAFIEDRYFRLKDEVLARNFNITLKDSITEYRSQINQCFYGDYEPNADALQLSISRLIEKIHAKPNWYRLHGKIIDDGAYCERLASIVS